MATNQQSLTDKIAGLQAELGALIAEQNRPALVPAPVAQVTAGEAVSSVAGSMGPYGILIDLGFAGIKAAVGAFTKAKAPQDVIDALQAAYDAVEAHQNDLITKANLEAQRA